MTKEETDGIVNGLFIEKRKAKGIGGRVMKKILISIFMFALFCIALGGKDKDNKDNKDYSTYEFIVVVEKSAGLDYAFKDGNTDFAFILEKGGGQANEEDLTFNYVEGSRKGIDDRFESYTYTVIYPGKSASNAKMKTTVFYYFPKTPDKTKTGSIVEKDMVDKEYRFMVGELSESDEKKVKERKYIDYKKAQDYFYDKSAAASQEYRIPLATGSTSVNAYPRYTYGENDSYDYDTFKNGNVITHMYEVFYNDPSADDDGDAGTPASTDKKKIHYTDIYYNHPISDLKEDGLQKFYSDHVVKDESKNDPDNTNDNDKRYYRNYLEIIKYVWFEPQDASNSIPPNSAIQNLKIKAIRKGSNRQRTSSVEINAGGYTEVVSNDPNPFKITEMEERGKN
ncbi:hypothetical protein [uncultured Ilyobacter sp.]|uniref:hypothetical protein n=1 Tax=uncultured Ilyobacter sp. TaxID=544433 RepID=UPI0029C9B11C|nr:hypothetical protein [uncultured Ilyobacter sp.]